MATLLSGPVAYLCEPNADRPYTDEQIAEKEAEYEKLVAELDAVENATFDLLSKVADAKQNWSQVVKENGDNDATTAEHSKVCDALVLEDGRLEAQYNEIDQKRLQCFEELQRMRAEIMKSVLTTIEKRSNDIEGHNV